MLEPDDLSKNAEVIEEKSRFTRKPSAIISAAELQHMSFPEPRFIVPNLIPEGLTILAGAPKIGKSWMALGVALAVASGDVYLSDMPCDMGEVLYLALEDGHSRLQDRLRKLVLRNAVWPRSLELSTEWERLDAGGLERLYKWISRCQNPRLIVVDVLTYIRPTKPDGKNQYQADFYFLSELQTLASRTGVGILVVHHNRKATSEAEPFERVSGTFGLTGAADTTLILDRNGQGVSLYGRGRDMAEFQRAVRLNPETMRWDDLGEASDAFRSDERKSIVNLLAANPTGLRPDQIAIGVGTKRNNIDQLLSKMHKEGSVKKLARGVYALQDVPSSSTDPQ